MGLNYVWNRLYQKGAKIYFLTVPCRFSKQNFYKIAANLERAINISHKKETRILHCVCGGSCKETINE